MTFRTSDILIGGSLIIIGLTEVAHLAGCLLGWSFLTVTDLMLAGIVIMVIAAILFSLIRHKKAVAVTVIAGKTAPEKKKVLRNAADSDRNFGVFHTVADPADPYGRTGMAGRRYDTGDGEYLP